MSSTPSAAKAQNRKMTDNSAPEVFFKATAMKEFKDGHKVLSVAEQEFYKEAYTREFDTQGFFATTGTCKPNWNASEETALLISGGNYDFEKTRKPGHERNLPNTALGADVEKVDGLRRRREMIEGELANLKKSISHKSRCLALSYDNENSKTLHPAMQQFGATSRSSIRK